MVLVERLGPGLCAEAFIQQCPPQTWPDLATPNANTALNSFDLQHYDDPARNLAHRSFAGEHKESLVI